MTGRGETEVWFKNGDEERARLAARQDGAGCGGREH